MAYVEPYHRGLKRYQTEYGTPWSALATIVLEQRRAAGRLMTDMIEVRDRYNADWVLPELEEFGDIHPLIIADTIDNLGMAAAQIDPNVFVPALNPAKTTGVRSREYADIRGKMLDATDHASAFDIGRGRAYRQLAAYGSFSLQAYPDFKCEHMRLAVRDPIQTYSEPKDPEDITLPWYYGCIYGLSGRQVVGRWADAAQVVKNAQMESMWDILQWWDGDACVIGILGAREPYGDRRPEVVATHSMELRRYPNRIGFAPGISPTQVTLDRIMSSVQRITGRADLLAKYEALNLMQSEKSVVPDRYIVGSQGQAPRMVAGDWLDGRSGRTNELVNVQDVGELRGTPDPSGQIAADRLEGGARRHVGEVPQMQGQTSGALRTGRGIDSLYAAATDPRITEWHRIMSHAKSMVNRAVLAGYKAYFGQKQFSMYSGREGDSFVDFTPDIHVEVVKTADQYGDGELCSVANAVSYPVPGADVMNTTMAIGQMRAMGVLSLEDAMRMHPWISDPKQTRRRMLVEDFENLVKGSLAQRMAPGGGIPPADQVQILRKLEETGSIADAIALADELASKHAEELANATPEERITPEMQPGLGLPGERGENQSPLPPTVEGPSDAQANLKAISLALKQRPPAGAPAPAQAS